MLNHLGTRPVLRCRVDHVPPIPWTEQGKRDQQQQSRLPLVALGKPVTLSGRREDQHGRHRTGNRHQQIHPTRQANQQQLGVEDEHEGQNRCPNIVREALHTRSYRVRPGDSRRRVGGQPHGRRIIRQYAEIEHEQVDSNQRHQQAVLGTQCHDNRGHQGGNHDVVGGRR